MTDVITCPGCGRRLVLPTGVEAELLSCPKCLAQIPNPRQQAAAAPAGIQTQPPVHRPVVPACPSCDEAVQPAWRYCPNCNEPLREPRLPRAASMDHDVRGDSRKALGCVSLLAILGGVGSFFVLASMLENAGTGAGSVALTTLFCVLGFAAVVAIVQLARGKTPTAGKVVVGTLATFGALILVGLAWLIFMFVVCLVNPRYFH